jgi:hypothetical protein
MLSVSGHDVMPLDMMLCLAMWCTAAKTHRARWLMQMPHAGLMTGTIHTNWVTATIHTNWVTAHANHCLAQ